ncbi:hypothetical protein BDR26DRAFT_932546 [Obelidium mucronatum]|nr:hypothetical protein BDR26DRAFT_932546 [Obelidium mucronatum]
MSPLTRLRANPQEIVDPTKAPWPSRCAKPGSRRQAPKSKQGDQTKATQQTKAITASQVVLSNRVNLKKPKATIRLDRGTASRRSTDLEYINAGPSNTKPKARIRLNLSKGLYKSHVL